MFDDIKDIARRFMSWVYNWITVMVGVATGALAFLPDLITQSLSFLDIVGIGTIIAPLSISAETAAKITSIVALVKGILAWYQSRR